MNFGRGYGRTQCVGLARGDWGGIARGRRARGAGCLFLRAVQHNAGGGAAGVCVNAWGAGDLRDFGTGPRLGWAAVICCRIIHLRLSMRNRRFPLLCSLLAAALLLLGAPGRADAQTAKPAAVPPAPRCPDPAPRFPLEATTTPSAGSASLTLRVTSSLYPDWSGTRTVTLLGPIDSAATSYRARSDSAAFHFSALPAGRYVLRTSAIAHHGRQDTLFVRDSVVLRVRVDPTPDHWCGFGNVILTPGAPSRPPA